MKLYLLGGLQDNGTIANEPMVGWLVRAALWKALSRQWDNSRDLILLAGHNSPRHIPTSRRLAFCKQERLLGENV